MSQPAAGVRVTINGRSVEVAPGTLVVEAARRAGVHIPVFCYHPRLKPAGVCRMCLVRVQGQPRLVTACTTPVADGMVVDTRDPEALAAQRSVVEFLLLNHPLDCPVCDKGGECDLQDLTFKYGPAISRLADPKLRRPKAVELGPFIVLDQERCILCRRCVRFDDEVAQERQLVIEERAVGSVVTTAAGRPYQHPFTGNVVELCPVGALTARTYRFRARPWDLSPVASACTVCSVHCPARFDVRLGQLVRVVSPGGYMDHLFGAPGLMSAYHTPADDVPGAQGMGWLCDRGRFNHGYLHSPQRLAGPLAGRGPLKRALDWEQALQRAEDLLARAVEEHGPQAVGILGGGRLFWEEAVALARLARVLGTPHVDYRTAGQAVASLATPSGRSGRVEDLERASAVVVVGSPPVERAPVLDLAVRAALARGARVYAAGPCRPPYRASGVEFRPAWGQELAQWLRELAGVLAEAPGPVVVVWDGDGAWDGRAGLVGEALLELAETVERAGRQVGLLVPGAHPQARAAEAAGLVPGEGGLDTAGMLQALAAGELKALYVVGANPLATFPDRALVEQALAAAEAVIVQDLLPTETVQQADLVLACVPAPMRQGTLVDLDGRVRVHAMVVPPDGRGRPDGEILQELARRLARRLGRSLEPDQEGGPASPGAAAPLSGDGVAALEPARARRLWAASRPGRPQARQGQQAGGGAGAEAGQLRLWVSERLFAGGGTTAFDPHLEGVREGFWVAVHPADGRELGLAEGEAVWVRTVHGQAEGRLRWDASLARGWVAVPGGLAGGGGHRLVAWWDSAPACRLEARVAEGARR